MSALLYLIPITLFLGLMGLVAFFWAMNSGQYEDMEGAAQRILFDNDTDKSSRQTDTNIDENKEKHK